MKEKKDVAKQQARETKLKSMSTEQRDVFLKKEIWQKYKTECSAVISNFDKSKTELDRKALNFKKLRTKHTWMPEKRLKACEKTMKTIEVIRSIMSY